MPRTVTLAEMRTSVRLRGSYENSVDITDAVLTEYLNDGLAETWDLFVQKNDDRYAVTSANITYAALAASVPLPSNFYKMRKVEILDGVVWRQLHEIELDLAHRKLTVSGKRYRYREIGSTLVLYPTPAVAETIRVTCFPFFVKLVADGDTFDGVSGFEELPIKIALKHCYVRQDLDARSIDVDIDRLKARISSGLDARNAKPFQILPILAVDDDEWP